MDWPTITQSITAIAAFGALFMTWIGWKKATSSALVQARISKTIDMDYEIYKQILNNINDIQKKNSVYTSTARSHVEKVAKILNEWHGTPRPDQKRGSELIDGWAKYTEKLLLESYEIRGSAIELTRILDMSGAGFGDESKIYKSLFIVYNDMVQEMDRVQSRWIGLALEDTKPKQYDWLIEDTFKMIIAVEEFGSCVEDVLKHCYNKLVANNLNKPLKIIDKKQKRKMILESGLEDNRL